MEGQVCSEERCNCVDFLPFECSLCGKVYCLEHRSRFSHSCEGMAVVQPMVRPMHYASVKEMMSAVENRFEEDAKNGKNAEHYKIKSSAAPAPSTDGKFTKKLHELDSIAGNSASAKQRKISLKTREMMIKTKAQGNSSIAGVDRFFLCVHFAGSMAEASADDKHHTEYLFFSGTKTLGEVLQHIWSKYQTVVEHSAYYITKPELHKVRRDDLSLVMSTADSPQWQHWDRNWALQDCLANYEDIAVFPTTVDRVIASQEALAAAQEHALALAAQPPAAEGAMEGEEATGEPAVYEKREFTKGQAVWYHKIPAEVGARLSVEEMEGSQPMVMAKITGVHHDDFPNVYYSVTMHSPPLFTPAEGSVAMAFTTERQTDHTHLLPVSETFGTRSPAAAGVKAGAGGGSRSKAGDAASARLEQAAAAHNAAVQLQATLADIGKPIPIKVGFSNRDYALQIGSQCTVAQLKLLISTVTDVPVPAMTLIVKGSMLKNDQQLIKDTKIVSNTKVVVMSSTAHVV